MSTATPPPTRGVFIDEAAFHKFHSQEERLRAAKRELTKSRVKTVLGVIVDAITDAEPSSGFSLDALPGLVEGFKAKLEAANDVIELRALLRKHGTHTPDCAVIAVDDPPAEGVDCSCGWDEIEADFEREDKEREVAEAASEAAKAAAARQDAEATPPAGAAGAPAEADAGDHDDDVGPGDPLNPK